MENEVPRNIEKRFEVPRIHRGYRSFVYQN